MGAFVSDLCFPSAPALRPASDPWDDNSRLAVASPVSSLETLVRDHATLAVIPEVEEKSASEVTVQSKRKGRRLSLRVMLVHNSLKKARGGGKRRTA